MNTSFSLLSVKTQVLFWFLKIVIQLAFQLRGLDEVKVLNAIFFPKVREGGFELYLSKILIAKII